MFLKPGGGLKASARLRSPYPNHNSGCSGVRIPVQARSVSLAAFAWIDRPLYVCIMALDGVYFKHVLAKPTLRTTYNS